MRRQGSESGFTMVEMITVMAILSILMALTLYGFDKYRKRAYQENTRALIKRLETALEQYYEDFRAYPPDGYDPDQPARRGRDGNGPVIRGAQCLVYYLGTPLKKVYEVGRDRRTKTVGPYMEFKLSDLTLDDEADIDQLLQSASTQVIDAYGNPLQYDNTHRMRDGRVAVTQLQGAGPDPRSLGGGGVQARNPGRYDLWSTGPDPADPSDDIGNWE
ncbi:MAG: type II secretion system protein [Planctomycetota bacterium]|nr:MAG: type II secretion system protein [Planctomycetota bacterium]